MDNNQGRPTKEQMERPPIELWKGWVFHEQAIWSPEGNRFTQRDIELSWQASQLIDGFFGRSSNIRILKDKLIRERRLTTIPKVCLIFEDETGITEKVFELKEQ